MSWHDNPHESIEHFEEWSNELAGLIPDGDESKYSNPEGAQEAIVSDCFRAYREQLDAIRKLADDLRIGDSADRYTAKKIDKILGRDDD